MTARPDASGRVRRAPGEPGLGPYRGPAVVLALVVAILVLGLGVSLVGAVRAPEGVSNSATILGTFPIDPDAPGIPAGPAGQTSTPDPGGASTVPGGPGSAPSPEGTTGSIPGSPPTSTPPASVVVVDAFDEGFEGWETNGGDWIVADGALVVPAGSDEAPSFARREGDASTGIGGEVGTAGTDVGLVVGFADPGSYVAAVAVPDFGGWRLEVWTDGEVASDSPVAATRPGTQVQLAVRDGRAMLVVDGAEVTSLDVAVDGLGAEVGFVSRGEAGATWASLLEGPGA